MLRKFKAFTTVEILVAVGLIAILMVVAVPRLLDSREAVSDSSAKQQINAVKMAVDTWFAERDTYSGLEADIADADGALQSLVPEVDVVGPSDPTGKPADGRALRVSVNIDLSSGADGEQVILVASNGEGNCWGVKLASRAGTQYAGAKAEPASCNASTSFTWEDFEYPQLAD